MQISYFLTNKQSIMKFNIFFLLLLEIILTVLLSCSGQKADLDFDSSVANPTFTSNHPKVLFDEGHNNSHTSEGTYKPFVDLIKNDGYKVEVNNDVIRPEILENYNLLIISNAKGKKNKYDLAFSENECSNIYNWVENGGGLLLIADHYPFGSAVSNLSEKFGIVMNKGETFDYFNYDTSSSDKAQLVFSEENKLLPESKIKGGRSTYENVRKVITFTGQSLYVADTNAIILRLPKTAMDIIPDSTWTETSLFFFTKTYTRFSEPRPSKGNAQGVALNIGKGRVIVLGEAAMLTSQIADNIKFGMDNSKNDNKQFALNLMHWLSKIL